MSDSRMYLSEEPVRIHRHHPWGDWDDSSTVEFHLPKVKETSIQRLNGSY